MSISQALSLSSYFNQASPITPSLPGKAYETTQAEAVVAIGRKYIGNISGISTDASLVTFDLIEGDVINDFRVLFEDVSTSIQLFRGKSYDWVSYKDKLQERRKTILEGRSADESISPLRMNCWEFCLLALVDAQVIPEEEMQKLCSICKNKQKGGEYHLVDVFLSRRGVKLTRENQHSLKPGDLLFHIRNEEESERPFHVMMVSGDGTIIQNNAYPPDLHEKKRSFDFDCMDLHNEKLVFIPFEAVRGNIEEFIRQDERKVISL